MRARAKVDRNQSEIVDALRSVGASVFCSHQLGSGFPDLVVGFRGRNYLLEVKDGELAPSKRELTDDEKVFFLGWQGQVAVVGSVDQALAAIGLFTEV